MITSSRSGSEGDEEDYSDLKCERCGEAQPLSTLRNCPGCVSIFHLTCLDLPSQLVELFAQEQEKWRCPRWV